MRIAERLVAAGDEAALLIAQLRQCLGVEPGERRLVGRVDLAIESCEIGIGADRLFGGLARGAAVECRQEAVGIRGGAPVAFLAHVREAFGRDVELRIDAQRRLVISDGMLEIVLLVVSSGAVVVSEIETGIERKRAVVIGDGAVEIALAIVGIAAVGEEVRLRRQPDRFVIVGDGAVVVAVVGVGQAAIVVIFRIERIEPDRLAFVGKGAVVLAELLVGGAAVGVGARFFRIEPDRLVVILDRRLVVLLEIEATPRSMKACASFGARRIASL